MAINIERLLRITADYHNFCNVNQGGRSIHQDDVELNEDELELISAASGIPIEGTCKNKTDDQE